MQETPHPSTLANERDYVPWLGIEPSEGKGDEPRLDHLTAYWDCIKLLPLLNVVLSLKKNGLGIEY